MRRRKRRMAVSALVKAKHYKACTSTFFFMLLGPPFHAHDYIFWLGPRHTMGKHKKL